MKKIIINGFGRIGRAILKSYAKRNDSNHHIHLVNFGSGRVDDILHFLKYDSTHGTFSDFKRVSDDSIMINDKITKFIGTYNMDDINCEEADAVLECTGKNLDKKSVNSFITKGVKRVILSAPAKGEVDKTIIIGVNDDMLAPEDRVISIGSCTTNCLAPVAKALHQNFTITSGFMTTVHAYTNDQRVLDSKHKDLRRARACAVSMIPTSTGAAKAISLVMPELSGKLDGVAIRVPVPNVSLVDLTITTQLHITAEEVNNAMIKFAATVPNVLGICTEELVSTDFNGSSFSSVFDTTQTKVVGTNMLRVLSWYDNEWGFANRMLDAIDL